MIEINLRQWATILAIETNAVGNINCTKNQLTVTLTWGSISKCNEKAFKTMHKVEVRD